MKLDRALPVREVGTGTGRVSVGDFVVGTAVVVEVVVGAETVAVVSVVVCGAVVVSVGAGTGTVSVGELIVLVVRPKVLKSEGGKLNDDATEFDAKNDERIQAAFMQRDDEGTGISVVVREDSEVAVDGSARVVVDGVVDGTGSVAMGWVDVGAGRVSVDSVVDEGAGNVTVDRVADDGAGAGSVTVDWVDGRVDMVTVLRLCSGTEARVDDRMMTVSVLSMLVGIVGAALEHSPAPQSEG